MTDGTDQGGDTAAKVMEGLDSAIRDSLTEMRRRYGQLPETFRQLSDAQLDRLINEGESSVDLVMGAARAGQPVTLDADSTRRAALCITATAVLLTRTMIETIELEADF